MAQPLSRTSRGYRDGGCDVNNVALVVALVAVVLAPGWHHDSAIGALAGASGGVSKGSGRPRRQRRREGRAGGCGDGDVDGTLLDDTELEMSGASRGQHSHDHEGEAESLHVGLLSQEA